VAPPTSYYSPTWPVSEQPARPNTSIHYRLFTPHILPMPPGQLNMRGWQKLMAELPDPAITSAIIGIYKYGARISYEGPTQPKTIHPNLSSATLDAMLVSSDIEKALKKNHLHVFHNFDSLPPHYIASPLGLTYKADGSKRRIHHLSYIAPGLTSINSRIPEEYGTITYSSIKDAIKAVQMFGKKTSFWSNATLSQPSITSQFPLSTPLS